MGDPLRPLPLLVRLSRETVHIIRQNILIFAFGVNAAGIVLTAWLWPLLAAPTWYEQGPVAAVLYHQLGSLAVLLNSMRLLWFDRASANPTWQRWSDRLVRLNHWMEHRFDLDEAFHWLGHHGRLAGVMVFLALLFGYALSGLTQVGADEIAIVSRFGRPLSGNLGPGLYWRSPWPIETVTRVQPRRIHTVEIGFRTLSGSAIPPGARPWSSTHDSEGIRRLLDEAVMITGDGNLLELQGTIRYTIADPRVYLFEVRDPAAILRNAGESVLRETVAGRGFAELLTTQREVFQREALARLEARCRDYGPAGLGVQIDGLSLHDLHPPQEVVGAYHEVTKAMEAHDKRVNEAQAEKITRKAEQEGKSLQTIRQAQAARTEKVELADARGAAFLARHRARTQLTLSQEWRLMQDSWLALEDGQAPSEVVRDYTVRREQIVAVQAALIDFRLYWEALSAALTGREKIVIDADKVPGRRTLWMVPIEPFRFPLPGMMPSERSPRGNREEP
jgi:Cu+-exporting ATPase